MGMSKREGIYVFVHIADSLCCIAETKIRSGGEFPPIGAKVRAQEPSRASPPRPPRPHRLWGGRWGPVRGARAVAERERVGNRQEGLGSGPSLVVQWLRLGAAKAGDLGSTPGQGARSHTAQLRPGAAK